MVQPAASARLLVNESALPETLETGIAIANPSPTQATVFLELVDVHGDPTGPAKAIQLPPFGQFAQFLTEIPGFPSTPTPFRGVLRVHDEFSGVTVAACAASPPTKDRISSCQRSPAVGGAETSTFQSELCPISCAAATASEIVLFGDRPPNVSAFL
jgi:hypothetical protein